MVLTCFKTGLNLTFTLEKIYSLFFLTLINVGFRFNRGVSDPKIRIFDLGWKRVRSSLIMNIFLTVNFDDFLNYC